MSGTKPSASPTSRNTALISKISMNSIGALRSNASTTARIMAKNGSLPLDHFEGASTVSPTRSDEVRPASSASESYRKENRALKEKEKDRDLATMRTSLSTIPQSREWTEEMFKRARPMRENPEMLKRMLEASANLRERKKYELDRSKLGDPVIQDAAPRRRSPQFLQGRRSWMAGADQWGIEEDGKAEKKVELAVTLRLGATQVPAIFPSQKHFSLYIHAFFPRRALRCLDVPKSCPLSCATIPNAR